MTAQKPCCATAATSKVKKLKIGNSLVGLSHLDSIIEEISGMEFHDDREIKQELLTRIKVYNYVSAGSEGDYEKALWNEYKKQVFK